MLFFLALQNFFFFYLISFLTFIWFKNLSFSLSLCLRFLGMQALKINLVLGGLTKITFFLIILLS